ncbi:major tail protein [Clostridium perfringens]|uniref:major tail protein n=1 Tax=Clostridium perfringens TaxID=1502 RepID=UPI00232B8EC3|nr:major tail protein [Clostridium perfringens]MDB2049343.1 hypothetical protein [Clostridium perfringens]
MTVAKKRLKGFRNVHFAPVGIGNIKYIPPVRLEGGKKVNIELKYELEEFESDDMIDEQEYIFVGGDGTLVLKSLTPAEYKTLFGNTVNGGEVAIRTTDISPNGALLFERQIRGTREKRLYVVYNTKFAPSAIAAESVGKGGGEIDEELSLSVGEGEDNLVVFFLDTLNATPAQKAKIAKWYTEVQFPSADEVESQVMKVNTKKKEK